MSSSSTSATMVVAAVTADEVESIKSGSSSSTTVAATVTVAATTTTVTKTSVILSSSEQQTDIESMYRLSLKIREANLGRSHPQVAQSLNNLALFLSNQLESKHLRWVTRSTDWQTHFIFRISRANTSLVMSHAATRSCHSGVARSRSCMSARWRSDAARLETRASRRRPRSTTWATSSASVLRVATCLVTDRKSVVGGAICFAWIQKDFRGAEENIKEALQITNRYFNDISPRAARIYINLARVYKDQVRSFFDG